MSIKSNKSQKNGVEATCVRVYMIHCGIYVMHRSKACRTLYSKCLITITISRERKMVFTCMQGRVHMLYHMVTARVISKNHVRAFKYSHLMHIISTNIPCIILVKLIIKLLHRFTVSDLPTHWDPQSPGKIVHLVSLQTSSQEYQDVLTHFEATGGVRTQINIERVQNPGLYKQYLAKKATMDGGENEKQLFHGTRFANTPSINANNFNRNLAETRGDLRLNWEVKINHENVQDDAR